MVKNVLVPTDGSTHAQKAIDLACDIAMKYDAKVYLLHVVSKTAIPEWVREYVKSERIEGSTEKAYWDLVGKRIIEAAERQVKAKGLKYSESMVAEGDPTEKILQYAKNNSVDMIVIGSRGLGDVMGKLLGSVSHKVCSMSECTCVTVK